jgi:hypothetical protein
MQKQRSSGGTTQRARAPGLLAADSSEPLGFGPVVGQVNRPS